MLLRIPEPLINQRLRASLLQGKLVRNHGDELAIGGLVLAGGDLAAEGTVQGLDAAAAPGNLDGMADGALYLAGCGGEAAADAGVQLFGGIKSFLAI